MPLLPQDAVDLVVVEVDFHGSLAGGEHAVARRCVHPAWHPPRCCHTAVLHLCQMQCAWKECAAVGRVLTTLLPPGRPRLLAGR